MEYNTYIVLGIVSWTLFFSLPTMYHEDEDISKPDVQICLILLYGIYGSLPM